MRWLLLGDAELRSSYDVHDIQPQDFVERMRVETFPEIHQCVESSDAVIIGFDWDSVVNRMALHHALDLGIPVFRSVTPKDTGKYSAVYRLLKEEVRELLDQREKAPAYTLLSSEDNASYLVSLLEDMFPYAVIQWLNPDDEGDLYGLDGCDRIILHVGWSASLNNRLVAQDALNRGIPFFFLDNSGLMVVAAPSFVAQTLARWSWTSEDQQDDVTELDNVKYERDELISAIVEFRERIRPEEYCCDECFAVEIEQGDSPDAVLLSHLQRIAPGA